MAVKVRYDNVAIWLHWTIAALMIGNIGLGHVMVSTPLSMRPILAPIHIWIGVSVLLLSLVRIGWRITHPKPPYPIALRGWEKALAQFTQIVFYVLMIGLPLLGYFLVSANPPNPKMTLQSLYFEPLQTMSNPQQKILHDQFVTAHVVAAWILVVAILLHLAGILKHMLVEKVNLLNRMRRSTKSSGQT